MEAKNPTGPSCKRLPVSAMESPKLYMALIEQPFDSTNMPRGKIMTNKPENSVKEKKLRRDILMVPRLRVCYVLIKLVNLVDFSSLKNVVSTFYFQLAVWLLRKCWLAQLHS
jgi:hypothetical protein